MSPRTGTEYSDDFNFELARNSSAAPHRRFSSSVVFAGMADHTFYSLKFCGARSILVRQRAALCGIRFLQDSLQEPTDMADENPIERNPIHKLHQEEGAQELAESEDMEPYLDFAVALMQGNTPAPELEVLRQLPLEKVRQSQVGGAQIEGARQALHRELKGRLCFRQFAFPPITPPKIQLR